MGSNPCNFMDYRAGHY